MAPWNAGWTGEDYYEIRPCRWAGGKLALWSPHDSGNGKPIFAKPHMVRQRQSVVQMLCTVCGKPTSPSDRWWFGLGNFVENGVWATTESPVHQHCAALSLRVCPHLRSLGVVPERFPPADAIIGAVIGGANVDRDFGLNLRDRKVIGHMKLAWKTQPRRYVQLHPGRIAYNRSKKRYLTIEGTGPLYPKRATYAAHEIVEAVQKAMAL